MTTPLATIADALIEFILSLLSDPAAAAEFEEDPEGSLSRANLSSVCVEDVKAVAPVIVDRPDVYPKPVPPGPPGPPKPPTVKEEIYNITNSFSIDNRATIVDQSVNQNIWAQGDVNQIFDQEAVVNSGDNGVAAGEDADVDNSDTDVTVGDVSIGNDETTTNIDGSFTCTLFFPHEGPQSFAAIKTESDLLRFFESTFADLAVLSYAEIPARVQVHNAAVIPGMEA